MLFGTKKRHTFKIIYPQTHPCNTIWRQVKLKTIHTLQLLHRGNPRLQFKNIQEYLDPFIAP